MGCLKNQAEFKKVFEWIALLGAEKMTHRLV